MEVAKRVVINTGFLYGRMAITVFISLYSTRLILAALGVEDFGVFNVVGGAIAMLTSLNAAMTVSTQRFMSFANGEGEIKKRKSIFNVSVVLHLIIGVALVLILEMASLLLFEGVLKFPADRIAVAKIIYQFMVLSTFLTVVSVPYDAAIIAREDMLFVSILGVLEALMKLSTAIYLSYTSFDKLVTYGFLMAGISLIAVIIRRVYCHLKYEEITFNYRKYYNKRLFREMTSFAGWSFLGTSTGMIANYGQLLIVNVFFGTVVNAAQGIVVQISGQLSAFAGTLIKALSPVIAKSEGAGNRKLMQSATIMGVKSSFFLLTLFYIPIMVEMPYIFKLWLKNVPEFAVLFCQLQLIRNLIEQVFLPLVIAISAVGRIKKYQIYSSISSLLALLVSYFLFYIGLPAYYMYITFIIYASVMGIQLLYFSSINFNFPVKMFLKNVVLRCILSFVVVIFITYIPIVLLSESLVRLFFVVSISVVSNIFVFWKIGLNYNERLKGLELIPSLRKSKRL